jgi:hypothetical protein
VRHRTGSRNHLVGEAVHLMAADRPETGRRQVHHLATPAVRPIARLARRIVQVVPVAIDKEK